MEMGADLQQRAGLSKKLSENPVSIEKGIQ